MISSVPNGSTGEPARESRLGVVGPENSAFVSGRGPLAIDDRLDRECMSGRAALTEDRLDSEVRSDRPWLIEDFLDNPMLPKPDAPALPIADGCREGMGACKGGWFSMLASEGKAGVKEGLRKEGSKPAGVDVPLDMALLAVLAAVLELAVGCFGSFSGVNSPNGLDIVQVLLL